MTDRIHFFSSGDLSMYYYADRAEALVLSVSKNVEYSSINDVFELYHAMKIMKSIQWKDTVPIEHTCKIKEKCDLILEIVIKYLRAINLTELPLAVDCLETGYFKSLWEIFANCMLNKGLVSIIDHKISSNSKIKRQITPFKMIYGFE